MERSTVLADTRRPRLRSRAAAALLVPFVAIILVLTLSPSDTTQMAGAFECLICGDRGLADVILNILLFVPVGFLATLAGGASLAIVGVAAVFSAGVEIAQFWIPGRDASPGDLLFNTSGTFLGVVLAATAPRWLRPRRSVPAALVLSLLVVGVVFATARFSAPRIPADTRWFAWWNAELDHLEPYDGVVLESSIGGVRVEGSGWVAPAVRDSLARALAAGEPVIVRGTAGSPPDGLAGFFAIYDEGPTEVVLIGPDGDDLVVRLHLRAADVQLDKPEIRLDGALAAYGRGDPLEITMSRSGGSYCVGVGEVLECGLGIDVSRGWALLMSPDRLPGAGAFLVGLGWCLGLGMLLGFYARTGAAAVIAGTAWILTFVVAPVLDAYLLPVPWPAFLAGALGFLAAAAVGTRLSRRSVPVPVEHAQVR